MLNDTAGHTKAAPGRSLQLYFYSVRILCLVGAIWIGFASHWSGLAWIPVGALLMVAIVAKVATGIGGIPIRLKLVYQMYRLAHELSLMSPTTRERSLSRMDPEFREYFLRWLNKP